VHALTDIELKLEEPTMASEPEKSTQPETGNEPSKPKAAGTGGETTNLNNQRQQPTQANLRNQD
jgi:hypothetical protein